MRFPLRVYQNGAFHLLDGKVKAEDQENVLELVSEAEVVQH